MDTTTDEWLAQAGGLGAQLRALRKRARITGGTLAADLGWQQSKVSKIENGKQLPTSDDITVWTSACGADEVTTARLLSLASDAELSHKAWRVQMRSGQVAIQRRYTDIIRQASLIRNLEVIYIPGLLQTSEYARARLVEAAWLNRENPSDSIETVAAVPNVEIAAAISERVRRQEILYEPGRQFEFIVTEASLRLLLCQPEVMIGQLDRLLTMADGIPNVSLGVIPFGTYLPFTPQNGFLMLDEMVVVETIGGETMHRGNEVAAYAAAWPYLKAEARFGAEARQLITSAMQTLRSGGSDA